MKNKTTLLMVGILAAVSMLSAGLAVLPTTMQQASANGLMDEEDGGDTSFSFEQEQKNKCSGDASCSNTATITFGVE
jgi:hypothetical protein